MPVPSIVVDGTGAGYGTPTISINGNVYKLNNLNIDRPFEKAVRPNNDGRPRDQRWTAGVATMSGELQYEVGTASPQFGDEFTLTIAESGYGAETWVVMPIGTSYTNGAGDMRVQPFSAEKRLNNTAVTKVS